ncbi:uncharacterized protein LOC143019559 [Oratosquilla oratoria]|uniref:uncharacterized protein LOC143019559 n=1 Tax=Oratosquilla oratoria TaxID=337810 RepID=UPI003F77409E
MGFLLVGTQVPCPTPSPSSAPLRFPEKVTNKETQIPRPDRLQAPSKSSIQRVTASVGPIVNSRDFPHPGPGDMVVPWVGPGGRGYKRGLNTSEGWTIFRR